MKARFTRLGVRYRLARTFGSRWGPGKVHLTYYDRENKAWRLVCRPDAWYHLDRLPDDEQANVTCKSCRIETRHWSTA
jgi:hypothetical protein